jgi:hypothetical protein
MAQVKEIAMFDVDHRDRTKRPAQFGTGPFVV